jgi:hypothetical protein
MGSPDGVAAALRKRPLPVIARVNEGELCFDLKTVFAQQDDDLARAIADTCAS